MILERTVGCVLLVLVSAVAARIQQAKPQTNQTKPDAPVVNECWPQSGSVNSVIELHGLRLGSDEIESAKAFFLQNGVEIPARTGGGSSISNDRLNGPQTLDVIVPEEVVPGPAQIVAERNGFRSAPVAIMITEWRVPVIKQVLPTTGPPGTVVRLECENFHINDEVELTDAEGRLLKSFASGGSSGGTSFTVPKDFPEGVLRIRIGNRKLGKNQFTQPVEFLVTNEALPLELLPEWIKPVAPGQWVDLQALSLEPLKHAEKTEVLFKQTGREVIVNAPRPQRPRVEVPQVLSPGKVQVQVRTWRNGHPSAWSTAVALQLAEQPLPPYVQALRLEKDTWVQLWPGPDRAARFNASPGDVIAINGLYPVAGADELKVLLMRGGEVVELDVTELNEKADWFSEVSVKLPAEIGRGNWQMILRAIDGTEHLVPIPVRIFPK
jgi:hypothetical protein